MILSKLASVKRLGTTPSQIPKLLSACAFWFKVRTLSLARIHGQSAPHEIEVVQIPYAPDGTRRRVALFRMALASASVKQASKHLFTTPCMSEAVWICFAKRNAVKR